MTKDENKDPRQSSLGESEGQDLRARPETAPDAADNDIGLSVDMLDVDRLKSWASLIEIHGNDISHWAQAAFVVSWLREFAGRLDATVRDVGTLRARGNEGLGRCVRMLTDVLDDCRRETTRLEGELEKLRVELQ